MMGVMRLYCPKPKGILFSQNTTPFLDRGVYFRLKILGKILEKGVMYFIFVKWK